MKLFQRKATEWKDNKHLAIKSPPTEFSACATFWFSFLDFVFAHAFIHLCIRKIIILQIKTKTTKVISHSCRPSRQHKGTAALLAVHKATRYGRRRWNVSTRWVLGEYLWVSHVEVLQFGLGVTSHQLLWRAWMKRQSFSAVEVICDNLLARLWQKCQHLIDFTLSTNN